MSQLLPWLYQASALRSHMTRHTPHLLVKLVQLPAYQSIVILHAHFVQCTLLITLCLRVAPKVRVPGAGAPKEGVRHAFQVCSSTDLGVCFKEGSAQYVSQQRTALLPSCLCVPA
jgi:hypothetical protein